MHLVGTSTQENGCICVKILSSSTGGRVEGVDKPPACVMLSMSYLTVFTIKPPEKGTQHINPSTICLRIFIRCLLIMM